MFSERFGPVQPWWRIRMVWLALGGPLLVVVASVVTLVLAVQGRDRPVADIATQSAEADAPAIQARNHVVAPRR